MPQQPALPKARPVVAASAAWAQWRPTIRPPTQTDPAKGQGRAAVLPRSLEAPQDPNAFWGLPAVATFPKSGAWNAEQMRAGYEAAGMMPGGSDQPAGKGTKGAGRYQHPVWPSPAFRYQGKGKPGKTGGSTAVGPAGTGAKGKSGWGTWEKDEI